MSVKNIIALMLTSTVCAMVIATVVTALFYPPGTVTETFRQKIFEILNIILGAVIMYLGLPKEKQDEKKETTTGKDAITREEKGKSDDKDV